MRALITGVGGFVGTHVAAQLADSGAEVFGVSRREMHSPFCTATFAGSVSDPAFLERVIRNVRPTHVVHLAAVIAGEAQSRQMFETNVLGTATLLGSVLAGAKTAMVLISSSSSVYGQPPELPLREDHPFAPASAYAASKAAEEMVGLSCYLGQGLRVVRTRTFNVTGPGQPASLVNSSIAKQIAGAEEEGRGSLRVGNMETRRDFVDVRDVARAFVLLTQHGTPGDVYNVCSGTSHSVRDSIEVFKRHTTAVIDVTVDSDRIRTGDIADHYGSNEKLRSLTGWNPEISFEQSLRDLLDYWRTQVRAERTNA